MTVTTFRNCGTYGGYQAHHRAAEPACGPCRAANAAYSAATRAINPAARDRVRWLNATRGRALERLAREHPHRFLDLLADERKERRRDLP